MGIMFVYHYGIYPLIRILMEEILRLLPVLA